VVWGAQHPKRPKVRKERGKKKRRNSVCPGELEEWRGRGEGERITEGRKVFAVPMRDGNEMDSGSR